MIKILSDDNLSASLHYILAAASKFLLVVLSCPQPSQIKTKRLGKRQSPVTFKVNTQFICGQRGQSALRQIWSEDKRQFSLISTLRELLISSHSNYIMIPLRRREKKVEKNFFLYFWTALLCRQWRKASQETVRSSYTPVYPHSASYGDNIGQ